MTFEGVNLPYKPVRFEHDRGHAVIEKDALQSWQQAGWVVVVGSSTEPLNDSIRYLFKVARKQ